MLWRPASRTYHQALAYVRGVAVTASSVRASTASGQIGDLVPGFGHRTPIPVLSSGNRLSFRSGRLQHAAERVSLERVAEFEVVVEHGIALVASKLFQPGGVDAAIHAGGQGAALEAVAAEGAGI